MKQVTTTDHGRRNLLLALGAGSVGAAAIGASMPVGLTPVIGIGEFDWWDRMFFSLETGDAAEWQSVVGDVFTLDGENGSVPVRLDEVSLFPSEGARPRECSRSQAFALNFLVSVGNAPVGNRTYRLTHPTYPPLDIFIGAATVLPQGAQLAAVFN
jgi:hypothetical protein